MKSNICSISRWQLLKSKLQNLDFKSFIDQWKNDSKGILIDVRTKEELFDALSDDVLHLDYLSPNLADLIEALDTDLHYYVYCRTGRRSLRVCTLMRHAGFKHVYNLENGIGNKTS